LRLESFALLDNILPVPSATLALGLVSLASLVCTFAEWRVLLHARFVRQIALSVKLEYTQGAEWFNVGRYGGRDLAGSPVVALDLR